MTDERRFDDLAKALGLQSSRRDGLKAIVFAAGAALSGQRRPRASVAAAADCIAAGEPCDGSREPSGCCGEAVCLFVAEGEFRCCIPAGSQAICAEDGACCSGVCNDDDHRCGAAPTPSQPRPEISICVTDDECPRGSSCCAGLCTRVANDSRNCGACGWRCPDAECGIAVCDDGVCGLDPAEDIPCDGGGCVAEGACRGGVCQGTNRSDGTLCNGGTDPCVLNGICASGVCESVSAPNGTACAHTTDCIESGHCIDGVCIGSYVDFGTPCTGFGCTKDGICQWGDCRGVAEPNGTPCESGNVCAQDQVCVRGRCEGTKVRCENFDPRCANATCEPTDIGCDYAWFDDGTPCGDGGTCINGDCRLEGVDPCDSVTCDDGSMCVDGNCCLAETVCPGFGCCGNFREGRGFSHFCHAEVCCRVHLICGETCCLDGTEATPENDVVCACGTCQRVGEACDDGACPTCDDDFAPLVCVATGDLGPICCPEYRACGTVCCAPDQHCDGETQTCEHAYPRSFHNA